MTSLEPRRYMTRTDKREGWPRRLMIPLESEFVHGHYGDECYPEHAPGDFANCGYECCVVGWIATAFRDDCCEYPRVKDEPTEAERIFAREFLIAAGRDPDESVKNCQEDWDPEDPIRPTSVTAVEDLFEGWKGLGYQERLTPEQAAECWVVAAKACGYRR